MRRGRWFGVAVASLIAVAIVGVANAAYADGAWGTITSRWSGRCIDMRAQDGTGNGVLAQQWDCTGHAEQQFTKLRLNGDDDFLLQNQRSGRCLRASGGATYSGALIEQWDCNIGDPSQHWQAFDPGGNSTGAKWLINRNSGKCVEDSAWDTRNGILLTQNDCVMGWKQYWFGL